MENKKNRVYQWFVEPKNAHTNEVIARSLAAIVDINMSWSLRDNLGLPHRVYQIENHAFITELEKARAKFNLDFYIYSRRGNQGPIRLWALDKSRKAGIKRTEMDTFLCRIKREKSAVKNSIDQMNQFYNS